MADSHTDSWTAAVAVHLRISVDASRHAEFYDFLSEAIPYYEAPGGIRVRLLLDKANPERFIELVEYVDDATYRQDDERTRLDPQMVQLLTRWRAILAEPPTVEVYRNIELN